MRRPRKVPVCPHFFRKHRVRVSTPTTRKAQVRAYLRRECGFLPSPLFYRKKVVSASRQSWATWFLLRTRS